MTGKATKASKAPRDNKSLAIRDYKAEHPSAAPKDIAAALSAAGKIVSAQFVSTVLSNAKKKGGKVGKPGPKPAAEPFYGRRVAKKNTGTSKFSITDVMAVLELNRIASNLGPDRFELLAMAVLERQKMAVL